MARQAFANFVTSRIFSLFVLSLFACGSSSRFSAAKFASKQRCIWGIFLCACRASRANGSTRRALVGVANTTCAAQPPSLAEVGRAAPAHGLPEAQHHLTRFAPGCPRQLQCPGRHPVFIGQGHLSRRPRLKNPQLGVAREQNKPLRPSSLASPTFSSRRTFDLERALLASPNHDSLERLS